MGDPNRGLYNKFMVVRVDGQSAEGGQHEKCDYFVLDLTHDKHALPALVAYSQSCHTEYPKLSADLARLVVSIEAEREAEENRRTAWS